MNAEGGGSSGRAGLPRGPLDLLAKAALAPPEIARQAWAEWRRGYTLDETPWNEVRMLGSVAPRLKWLEKDASIAPRIQGIRKFLYAQTQICLMGAMEGLRALSGAGIPFMFLKGTARIARNPAAAQERLVRDVDILVHPEHKDEAIGLLLKAGWGFSASGRWQAYWFQVDNTANHHAWSYAKGNSEIDVHHFSNALNRLLGDDDALWQRAEPLDWRGLPLFVPSPTDNLIVSLAHGVRWSKDEAADWTVDASASIDSGIVDWPVFVAEIQSRKIEAEAAAGLRYLKDALTRPIPSEVLNMLEAGITPAQRAEYAWYAKSPAPRNFAEMANALEMSQQRLLRRLRGSTISGREFTLLLRAKLEPNAPTKFDITALDDAIGKLTIIVRLDTDLPRGTRILGAISIMGLLLDHAYVPVMGLEDGGNGCELTFSVFLPLLKKRGVKYVMFVAGIAGETTPFIWKKKFKA
ncbi:MAG: nucleotidyltransferase family protein [Rhizobiales bacterium]|nr:nucleotidyltransferase family protein [Hyphomicrobiales bacterium]